MLYQNLLFKKRRQNYIFGNRLLPSSEFICKNTSTVTLFVFWFCIVFCCLTDVIKVHTPWGTFLQYSWITAFFLSINIICLWAASWHLWTPEKFVISESSRDKDCLKAYVSDPILYSWTPARVGLLCYCNIVIILVINSILLITFIIFIKIVILAMLNIDIQWISLF